MDTLNHVIIIPPVEPADTIINLDLEYALMSKYDMSGIDMQALQIETPPAPITWEQGLKGTPRHTNAGDDPGVIAIITGMFLLMMFSYKYCRRLFSTLFNELLGMRHRANIFDEHTSNETQMLALMAVQWSVYTGLLFYSYLSTTLQLTDHTFANTTSLIGLMASYYLVQLCAYWLVGYTFSSREGCRYYVQGFTASQSLLGFLLIVPALVAIFYPEATFMMVDIGAGLYILARIIFIVKGFRIFYDKFSSLLYFILYLCTLEIIPLIVLYHAALKIVNVD